MPNELLGAFKKYELIHILAWYDIKSRYKRSVLGPFWLTLSMGIMIATIGIVFGTIFNTDLKKFFPFLTIGIILWGFIVSILTEGCNTFIENEAMIKQLPIPLFTYILRMTWRNIIILAHNIIILPLVFMAVGHPINLIFLLAIPGFILLLMNLIWVNLILGCVCVRYRDIPQIITSILQIVFYVTPIMWMPENIASQNIHTLVNFNPVYHMIEIVRQPLLGNIPSIYNWLISITINIIGWLVALRFFASYKSRITYWL